MNCIIIAVCVPNKIVQGVCLFRKGFCAYGLHCLDDRFVIAFPQGVNFDQDFVQMELGARTAPSA